MQLDHQLIIDLITDAVSIDSDTAEIIDTHRGTVEQVKANAELADRVKSEAHLREEYLSGTWDDVAGLAQALAGICGTNMSAEAPAAMAMPIIDVIDRAARALDLETCMDPNDRPVPF